MRFVGFHSLALALLACLQPAANAQRVQASFSNARAPLRVSRIDSASGLSHNSVYAVLRDRQGFVWAGTPDGLNRFDGYEVRRFHHDPDDPTSLSNQVVRCLLEDREGNLWVGTGTLLNRFDRRSHRFDRIPLEAERRAAREILTLFEAREGTLWVGTDRGVFRRDRSGRTFTHLPMASEGHVRDFAQSPDGVVWALAQKGTESALHALDGSGRTLAVAESWGWVTNFAIDSEGLFWLKPPFPARLDRSNNTLQPGSPPDRALVVNRIRLRSDQIWMATDHGLCHGTASTGVSCRPIDASASWLHNFVRDLWIDDEGAVWFGTYTGLSRFDPAAKPFETWSHDQRDPRTLSSDAVSAIVEGRDGALWVGTFGGGLNRLDRTLGEATRFRSVPGDPASLPHDTVWGLLLDPEDILWIATESGLASFDAKLNRFTRHALPFPIDERAGRRTAVLARDQVGRLWIGAAGGLYSYDPRTQASRRYALPQGTREENVEAILVDEDGTLWTGTGAIGLRRFDPKTGVFEDFPRLTKEQTSLSSEGLWDIHADGRGALWIATGMGLSRFDRSTRQYVNFLPRDGLPASLIYSIAQDRRGTLWLGTSRGLVRFDPTATRDSRFRTFEMTDGIAALEFNRRAAVHTRRGELCFGGIGGLTCFDPERIEDDRRPPRVVFTGIELAEGMRTVTLEPFGRDEIELRHDNDPFGFTFAALSFANPLKNLYQYRLEGFDRGWIDAGTRRLARYTNVPPGEYQFRVRASNSDLTWNREGTAIRVRILPPFWMTWWFRVFMVAIAASLLYGTYRYRVSRLIEMERFRLRIASDLHDDVTSELSGISMLAELVRRRLPQDPAAGEQLGSLRDRTTALASVMRDLAWGIHPEHDTAGSMVRRMRSTGEMLLGDAVLHIEVEGLEEDASLPMLVRRTLFLLYKEALHNSARHARAGNVSVRLRSLDHALEMIVSDDGAGFDPASAKGGDGLRNMRRRAAGVGGEIEIRSEPGEGTRVVVRVPLHPAERPEDS